MYTFMYTFTYIYLEIILCNSDAPNDPISWNFFYHHNMLQVTKYCYCGS